MKIKADMLRSSDISEIVSARENIVTGQSVRIIRILIYQQASALVYVLIFVKYDLSLAKLSIITKYRKPGIIKQCNTPRPGSIEMSIL